MMSETTLSRSLYEQAYHSLLNVLEEIFFDQTPGTVPDSKTYEFNWSRIKAFRYVMSNNSIALRKAGVKSSYYTVPYVSRIEGNA